MFLERPTLSTHTNTHLTTYTLFFFFLQSISAVPVLGMNGVVVGNVSARDLRNLVTDPTMFSLLHEPVRHFLAQASTLDHEAMNPAITCRATDTLEHVIQQVEMLMMMMLMIVVVVVVVVVFVAYDDVDLRIYSHLSTIL